MAIKVGVSGSSGKMGKWVADLLREDFSKKLELTATADREDSHEDLLSTDVIIDFSIPEGSLKLLKSLQKEN